MRPQLRIFTGEEQSPQSPGVRVRFDELASALNDAANWDRTWLRDFADDEVNISADLYEVLMAYNQLRPSA
ncbi:hypothetical protein [Calycomorphotria hydatis]|uniref:Uncharacterized protein n=1 Tax=Calycomorphotria hydatis TaxID=2528027 RepID=A0A517TC97_9PLAN|nr:hypothetical protein [Calycomorphotria hydatis]QDT65998.1 hypothetical protein V22_32620 [Calycomorphotria hydatis]